ncbi:MAG: methyltransferase domain-containing protein [Candidatus Scalindua sp. AMX11]|nr:MAG: methyltransferase domain-containing protein [Candidatus Scalindua sp.]NOG82951.1 methyltransferase domain-containing protein [Planctomycetota bacterium]RZV68748.1 MAG: methyltransferase domain-containing protein [Candidatus Scalindua sp. SCAELEC01]TDE63826.1 MAG: methyltransferase domain-containing protein [Candidatus Scalindua sp. AMX11]
MNKLYVQYGCGNVSIDGWLNFDSSPTLRIQKIPVLGRLLRSRLNCVFDNTIRYGDIIKGLPLKLGSVDGLFCSHVLEHLSYADGLIALKNSFNYLKPGGRFRIILPDLETYIKTYIQEISSDSSGIKAMAAVNFNSSTRLGTKKFRTSFKSRLYEAFRSRHHWMWDNESLSKTLDDHGFINVKTFQQGECDDEMFLRPEREYQFSHSFALECTKP